MYIGRFAPTPSGPLHLGSFITALASYLDAKHNDGEWKIRIDDIDTPRIKKGSEKLILNSLEAFGLHWDGLVMRQSDNIKIYELVTQKLKELNLTYYCECSRKDILLNNPTKSDFSIYNNACSLKKLSTSKGHSIRLKTNSKKIIFKDTIQGTKSINLELLMGDFIVKRSDNIFSYQLTTAIDDDLQSITNIVRGADLIKSTPQQIYIRALLKLKAIKYSHIPIVLVGGQKLSKSMGDTLEMKNPSEVLIKSLKFLNQEISKALEQASPKEIIQWAVKNWDRKKIEKKTAIELSYI